jgi:hypothetical protein
MSINFSLILDIFIAALLLTTVLYCWKLSRRITLLHEGKEDLNLFIQDFNKAILRAEDNIDQLKTIGESTDEKLNDHIQKARFLANDLSFLMDKGEHIADNLERQIGASRTVTARPPNPPIRPRQVDRTIPEPAPTKPAPAPARPTITPTPPPAAPAPQAAPPPAIPAPMKNSKKQALDEVLSQISSRKKSATNQNPATPRTETPAATAQKANIAAPTATTVNPFNNRKLADTLRATEGDK